jgi:hypothetical protein
MQGSTFAFGGFIHGSENLVLVLKPVGTGFIENRPKFKI